MESMYLVLALLIGFKNYFVMKKLALVLIIFTWMACDSDQVKENEINGPKNETTAFELDLPSRFPPIEVPDNNPLTVEGVELGRMLFYDTRLDADGKQSCATCHQQQYAFSSPDHDQHQIHEGIMPHFNLAWDRLYLWNGKVQGDIEAIMRFEVEEFFQTNLTDFNNIEEYKVKFKQVYGIDEIKYENIAAALAQFERALISGDSKFDQFLRKEVQLSEAEFRGFNLFFSESADCFHCHGTVLFKDNLMHNNGLDNVFEGADQGHFLVSNDPMDMGKFKTPSLRNIAVTAPYMHDNRFATLREVVNFYSEGVNFTEYTDPLMNHEGGISLTEEEREDLVAFLYTLTDSTFITNDAFSNPFKN